MAFKTPTTLPEHEEKRLAANIGFIFTMKNGFTKDHNAIRVTEEIWKKFYQERLDSDDVHRILAELFQRNYHKELKNNGLSHKEGIVPQFLLKEFDQFIISTPIGDHGGTIKQENKTLFGVFEPYTFDMKTMKEFITACEERNLDFNIDGESPHFVGKTVRILITPKDGKKPS